VGLLLLLFLLPLCIFAIVRRRRTRRSWAVPAALAVYSIISAAWFAITIVHVLAGAATLDASMKATLLAKGISELMNASAFGLIALLPILLAAVIVDRWLVSRVAPTDARDR
jgi:predicted permease